MSTTTDTAQVERHSISRQPNGAKNAVPSAGANCIGAFPARRLGAHCFSSILSSIGDARSVSHHRARAVSWISFASPATCSGFR